MKHLKLIFACLLTAIFSIGQVWGAVVSGTTYEVKSASTVPAGWTVTDSYSTGGGGYAKLTYATNSIFTDGFCQGGFTSIVIKARKFGSPSAAQAKITVEWCVAGSDDVVLGTLDPSSTTLTNLTISSPASVTANQTGNIRISCKGASSDKGSGVSEVTINYTAGDCSSVTPTCEKPTFTPASGATFTDNIDVTISAETGATIYYTTDGNDPTTSSTVYSSALNFTETTTLKAIAVKTGSNNSAIATATYTKMAVVTGYEIDFESDLAAYTDWEFANFTKTNESITAHDGSYFAKTNGTNTASITTKEKVANPGTLTYYISKIGTNTNANSKWKARVSENGSDWTIVGTEYGAGAGVTAGTWNECTADLRAYSNVYVQVYYDGTTAVRTIDDVELTMASELDKPSISGEQHFVTSTTVTLTQAEADHIYYTLDGTVPSSSSNLYSTPFTLEDDATVKAIAVKGSVESAVAEQTFTKVTALTTMAAVQAAAPESGSATIHFTLTNWVVTAAKDGQSQVWIADADNAKGILLYKNAHGFAAGDKLNGTVVDATITKYNGAPELTSLTASQVTVTTAEAITPRSTTIAALTSGHPAEQGTVVKLDNLIYSSSSSNFSDGANTISLDTRLYNPTLVDGSNYNLTGVVYYGESNVIKIMPRAAADVEKLDEASLPEVTNLSGLKAEERGSYVVNLTNAVVTLADGNSAFIEDATAGALIFFSGHGLVAGDCLNGKYEVNTADYKGKFEITAMTAQTGATKTTATVPETTMTLATLNANFADYESRRIKIEAVTVTDALTTSDRNGQISDGTNNLVLYAGKNGVVVKKDAFANIIAYPTPFKDGEDPLVNQFAVWAQADITIVDEDPELAYDPTVVNVLQSEVASFAPATLTYKTGFDGLSAITYESSDPTFATVTSAGVVELVGSDEGTAIITATFKGNANYIPASASYTITVSATPIAPVYTMSFDLTRASYDDAAEAQVVWNSNVVTMTADKNSGTKVTNYLAGNYSGTTLIQETRFYTGNSISFVPQTGVTITKVEWMSTAKGYATKLAAETFVNATAVVDGTDDKLVIITPSAAGEFSVTLADAARATNVKVYYEAESEKSKLAASIAIANINTAIGEEDILLSDIAATSHPNKKAISYAITSGTAVTLVGSGAEAAFHAAEVGTATITATIPSDFGNYTGATTTFDIVVDAALPTLESIAISGTASVLEYSEGQDFNPEGLVVTGTYSNASTAPIADGITWAFDPSPLTQGTTSVSVTATVGELTSPAFEVNGLTVSAAAAPTVDNVVILAVYETKYYAMSTTNANNGFTAIGVEYNGTQVTVNSEADKTAIQWTRTTNGANTTFQDADEKYMKGTDGASMSLDASVCNWVWDATGEYYKIAETSRTFFLQETTANGKLFKNYATSNFNKTGYSDKSQVIVIDPANIVITSKVSAELAYDPASDEITQGDSWSAPELKNPHSVTITSYASDNESVATVAGGVIALAGGIGTAHITAHFDGDASYLEGDAVYTIKVNAAPEPAEDCDGTDDFLDTEDKGSPTSYTNRSTPNGWSATNAGYKVIDEKAFWMINGKTTAYGVITSPELTGGLGSLKFRYANTNQESNGVNVKIEIKQGEDVVKEYTLTKLNSEVVQNTVYTELIEDINVAGTFQIVITNLCPSNNTGNKDRVSIGRFCWTGYTAPEPSYTEVRHDLTAGWYYTMCLDKAVTAVKVGSIWRVLSKAANGNDVILEEAELPLAAGRPYIFRAAASTLEVAYTGDAVGAPVNDEDNNGLIGSFGQVKIAQNPNYYIIHENALYYVNSDNVYVGANRAYLDMTGVPAYNNEPQQGNAPRRRVTMAVHGEQTATGFENINASEKPMKLMIDGQLFIIRGEKMYDATGRLVK